MDLNDLLNAMDRAAANLAKLDDVWDRARSFIPTGPARGSDPEYDDLRRAWADLLPGLPQIDGWTITDPLPDIDDLGQTFIDLIDIGEPPFTAYEAGEQPGKDLAEYRYRLNRARRRAARERLQQLSAAIDTALPRLLTGVPRDSQERLSGPDVDQVTAAVDEIERLMGDTVQRRGRCGDLHRHLHFGQGPRGAQRILAPLAQPSQCTKRDPISCPARRRIAESVSAAATPGLAGTGRRSSIRASGP